MSKEEINVKQRFVFKPGRILVYALLIFWSIVVLFPVYWVIISSLKLPVAVIQGATYFPGIDFTPTLKNFQQVLIQDAENYQIVLHFTNSLIASIGGALLALGLGSLASYGLSRFKYHLGPVNNNFLMVFIMGLRMLPPVSMIFAFLLMYQFVGLVDNVFGLMLVYATFNLPLVIWILNDAMNEIPRELDESAFVDGSSWFTTYLKIVMPLISGSLAACFLMCFIFNWNEYLFALILTYTKAGTVPMLLANSSTTKGVDWGRMSALTVLSIIPSVAAGVLLEKYLRKGALAGALKG
jgi:multiple sugar transport system permease protein